MQTSIISWLKLCSLFNEILKRKLKLTCRLLPRLGLRELPSGGPQGTPKPVKKFPVIGNNLKYWRNPIWDIGNNSKYWRNPMEASGSRLLCKMALIWGSVQFVGGMVPYYWTFGNTQHSGEKPGKSNVLPFLCDSCSNPRVCSMCGGRWVLAPIIGFARIGGGERRDQRERKGSGGSICRNIDQNSKRLEGL